MTKIYMLFGLSDQDPQSIDLFQKETQQLGNLVQLNFENEKINYGNLDNMLQSLEWFGKLEHVADQFLKWLHKQYQEIDSECDLVSLKLDTPMGSQDIKNYTERFEWDNSRYPKIGTLQFQVDNFQERLQDFDTQTKNSYQNYIDLKQEFSVVQEKSSKSTKVTQLDPTTIFYECEKDYPDKKYGDLLIQNSEHLQSFLVLVPNENFKEFEKDYEQVSDFIVPQSLIILDEIQEHMICHLVAFKSITEHLIQVYKTQYSSTVMPLNFDQNVIDQQQLNKQKIHDKYNYFMVKYSNQLQELFKETLILLIHIKFYSILIDSHVRYGAIENFSIFLLLIEEQKKQRLLQKMIQIFAEKDKLDYYGTKEQLNDTEDFYPFSVEAMSFEL